MLLKVKVIDVRYHGIIPVLGEVYNRSSADFGTGDSPILDDGEKHAVCSKIDPRLLAPHSSQSLFVDSRRESVSRRGTH